MLPVDSTTLGKGREQMESLSVAREGTAVIKTRTENTAALLSTMPAGTMEQSILLTSPRCILETLPGEVYLRTQKLKLQLRRTEEWEVTEAFLPAGNLGAEETGEETGEAMARPSRRPVTTFSVLSAG